MSEVHPIDYIIEVDVAPETQRAIRETTMLLQRSLSLLRRFGLPENLDAALGRINRFIAGVNALRTSILLLYTGTGPIGWALAGIGVATAVLDVWDVMAGY